MDSAVRVKLSTSVSKIFVIGVHLESSFYENISKVLDRFSNLDNLFVSDDVVELGTHQFSSE